MIGVGLMLEDGAFAPTKAHDTDAGFDLYANRDIVIPGGGAYCFDTGVHMVIPDGYVGMVKSKSGLNVKHGLQSEGVIDAGYTGTIAVKLYNHSSDSYRIEKGDKISQLVILPLPEVALVEIGELPDTERGTGGFGSTGK